MAFFDVSFPLKIAGGVSGVIERRTDVVSLASGREERNARWRDSRRRFDAGVAVHNADDLAKVAALFEEVNGRLGAFRLRDWSDFKSCAPSGTPTAIDQSLGEGDGERTAFALRKRYGSLAPYWRTITKPVAGSVVVAIGGTPQGSGWSVDNLSGVVTFNTAPAAGVAVTAGFLFDVPVRFDTDSLSLDMAFFSDAAARGVGTYGEIPLIEVRE